METYTHILHGSPCTNAMYHVAFVRKNNLPIHRELLLMFFHIFLKVHFDLKIITFLHCIKVKLISIKFGIC
jgi:hypothetical protein